MNYDSVNKIFSAGTDNMTCLFKDSGSYDSDSYAVNGAGYLSLPRWRRLCPETVAITSFQR